MKPSRDHHPEDTVPDMLELLIMLRGLIHRILESSSDLLKET
jgi:hypothetical protein